MASRATAETSGQVGFAIWQLHGYNGLVMIKTAIIIERAEIALGGAERSIFELASRLRALDVQATIVAAKGQGAGKNVEVLCGDSGQKRTSLADFAAAIKDHLSQTHYDIIHSTLPLDFADIYQPRGGSYLEAALRNVASYDNGLVRAYKSLTHRANLRRWSLLRAERRLCTGGGKTIVAAISEYVARQFREHYSLADERICTIASGIRTSRTVNPDAADRLRSQILAQIGVSESASPAIFLIAAHNFRLKGLTPLIKAMGKLACAETARGVYLAVAGAQSSLKYRQLARRQRVSDRIVFLGTLRHIQNALSICDVAVLPTWYDPCSRFILEALSAGKPVITTRFNGAAEMFTNDRHGITIDRPDDIESLAGAMAFYADEDNAEKARQAIVADDLKRYVSIDRHAGQIVELYKKILRDKGEQ